MGKIRLYVDGELIKEGTMKETNNVIREYELLGCYTRIEQFIILAGRWYSFYIKVR